MKNCPMYKSCGACKYPLDNYQASLKNKTDEALKLLGDYQIKEVKANPLTYHYRHKIIYRFFYQDKKIAAGFYQEGSGKLVAVNGCLIENEVGAKIIKDVLKIANKYHMEVYNPKRKSGVLRYLMMRISKDNKALLCFVLGNDFKGSNNFVKLLRDMHPEIVNIDFIYNQRDTSVVMEGKMKTIYGKGYIIDKLDDLKFHISSDAFYQVNPYMAEIIYNDVVNGLDIQKSDIILDAYCGIGTISLFLAKRAKNVIGVEINPKAIENAIVNAQANQIENVHFVCSDVKEYIISNDFDIMVVDPPRSGMDDEFIATIKAKKPKKLAYVSCNIETMISDLNKLASMYKIEPITLYDQFGFTKHFESMTICHLVL